MIDDELLQELLSKGSNLYNNGDYRGAISVWREALQVDPSSQRAREGIQMATLLLGDWEPPPVEQDGGPAPEPAADGAASDGAGKSPAELEKTLDEGIAGIKGLLARGKYPEALEGARALLPVDPESEEVRALLEEAQQAFEAAPFIEEHITLARELLGQDRLDEAETQCQKVFALDPRHPQARSLLAAIKARRDATALPPESAAGHTMKMSLEDVLGKKPDASDAGPAAPSDSPGARALADEPLIEPLEGLETPFAIEDAEASATDDVFEPGGLSLQASPPAAGPTSAREKGSGEQEDKAEEIEAVTVVAPSVRAVPRSPAPPAAVGPAASPPRVNPPAPAAPPAAGAPFDLGASPKQDAAAWEIELTQLNLKKGERDILGPGGLPAGGGARSDPAEPAEADLLSLLDDDFGTTPGSGDQGAVEAIALADRMPPPSESAATKPAAPGSGPAPRTAAGATAATAARPQSKKRLQAATPVEGLKPSEPRSSIPKYFALLGVVILAAAAAGWWFFMQPRTAGAPGAPGRDAAPPAGSSSGPPAAAATTGPIPTPIGASDRQGPPGPDAPAAAGLRADPNETARPGIPAPAGGAPAAGSPDAAALAPPMTPEQVRHEASRRLSNGRRLVEAGRWVEALDELRGAAGLDPGNMEIRDLADKAQAEADRHSKLTQEYEETRRLFDDKDYQNALWRLYRLPRDSGFGNIDLYIRNAWYNWAVVAMRAGDATDALQKLSEVSMIDPGDADARKMREVAERYSARAKDRAFFAFASSLGLRRMDQK